MKYFCILMLWVSMLVNAQTVYRQIDAQGRILFSQIPLQQNAEALQLSNPEALQTQSEKPVASKSKKTKPYSKQPQLANNQALIQPSRPWVTTVYHRPECEQSKQKIALAERNQYLTKKDKKGRERLMTEAERNKHLAALYKEKLKHCSY